MRNSDDVPARWDDGSSLNPREAEASRPVDFDIPANLPSEIAPEVTPEVVSEVVSEVAIVSKADSNADNTFAVSPTPFAAKPKPKPSLSLMLATRPLWQIVVGLGLGAIGLTCVAIGLFTLSGLALQGLGRAVAGLIAGIIVLILFGSIPAALTVFTIQTHGVTQHQGVSSETARLALGAAIVIGIAIGICSRLF